MHSNSVRNIIGVLLICGGLIHVGIIVGLFHENTPIFITFYFHSLAIIDLIAGYSVISRRRYAYWFIMFIGITQIFSHGYMVFLDTYLGYNSGVLIVSRCMDIIFSMFLIYFAETVLRSERT